MGGPSWKPIRLKVRLLNIVQKTLDIPTAKAQFEFDMR